MNKKSRRTKSPDRETDTRPKGIWTVNLDTILGHLGAVIFITVFVGLVYALALRESRKVRARKAVLAALDEELGACVRRSPSPRPRKSRENSG